MGVYVSMLRGVNVGGNNMIGMSPLRELYQSLGFVDPQTYVQSGNVVFESKERSPVRLAKQIEDAIEKAFGFRPAVIIRTASQLKQVIATNPFAGRTEVLPAKLLVTFLAADPGETARKRVLAIETRPEEMRMHSSELYIYYPDGAGRSKLPINKIQKALGSPGTARNWNSVLKLLEMAERREALRKS